MIPSLCAVQIASGLVEKTAEVQVNMLTYAMGVKANDILHSFTLSDEEHRSYKTVKSKFKDQQHNAILNRHNSKERNKSNTSQYKHSLPFSMHSQSTVSMAISTMKIYDQGSDRCGDLQQLSISEKLSRLSLDSAINQQQSLL